jgi:ABC-type antimicrobial peptide transport system permease subunit
MFRSVRTQLTRVNPEQQTLSEARTLEGVLARTPEWKQAYISSWIFGVFSALALVLAAIGLYSVTSYTVAQRANEFGVRIALGARRQHILGIVFRTSAASIVSGLIAGLGLTWAIRGMVPQWSGVDLGDPIEMIAIGATIICLVSGVACAIPAWRASTRDPLASIRTE